MSENSADSHMNEAEVEKTLPITPALAPLLAEAHISRPMHMWDRRVIRTSLIGIILGMIAAFIAAGLTSLIGLITNAAFYGRVSNALVSPAGHHLGLWVILVPATGGLIVGVMARWGSQAIRGHGIPEAMEQVLLNESRIAPRMTWLKPLSSAIAIGSGGPFGAEGPIIATGGAVGSVLGQVLRVTADERKTLLAAGAAAGMAAVFSAPVSAVMLAIELLLFERRARSLIPVAFASVAATGMRYILEGNHAIFAMSDIAAPGSAALVAYVLLGAVTGLFSIVITKLTYGIEDLFERLPVHWMWWPAIGGLVVGIVGYIMPRTLGVGYDNIAEIVNGQIGFAMLASLCLFKLISWSIALGSGTSGGTLAPLFTIGGALGGMMGILLSNWLPWLGIDPRIAALVGMAALFAGASRAFLTSVIFAFETTQQPNGLLPLLGGCAAACLISGLWMRNTIMTEKITRRGVRVPSDYSVDYLERVTAGEVCTRDVVSLRGSQSLSEVRDWLMNGGDRARFEGYPVINENHHVVGVITRRVLLDMTQSPETLIMDVAQIPPYMIGEDQSARDAADYMVECDIGRLIVVSRDDPSRMIGFVTRGDLLSVHAQRLKEARHMSRHLWKGALRRKK